MVAQSAPSIIWACGLDNKIVTRRYSVSTSYSGHATVGHQKHHNMSHASSLSSSSKQHYVPPRSNSHYASTITYPNMSFLIREVPHHPVAILMPEGMKAVRITVMIHTLEPRELQHQTITSHPRLRLL
jgi:hypothetical protein